MNSNLLKYPKTSHLPWSEGIHDDDRIVSSLKPFEGKEIIVTEKMDGENTSCYHDGYIHARSLDSVNHPSRNWVKNFWSSVCYKLPDGWRLCGENLYAKHDIYYENLHSYFYGFSIWDGNLCKSWNETQMWFEELSILSVPVLYRGTFNEKTLKNLITKLDFSKHEGYVVRVTSDFSINFADTKNVDSEFSKYVVKYVRKNHNIENNENWRNQDIVKNGLFHEK